MTHTTRPGHLLGIEGAMRPQLKLVAANGHDHGTGHRPAVVPLGEPYVDVNLAALERQAARDAVRAAERAELDAMLRDQAEAHIAERGTLLDLPRAARVVVWLNLATLGAVAAVMAYAWWLRS